jgi:molecular chaperone GrpE
MTQKDTNFASEAEQEQTNAANESNEVAHEESIDDAVQGEGVASDLQKQLLEAKAQADDHYQKFLRTQADFDNFRRRARQEKEEFLKYASAKLVEQLLSVIDNFDRALSSSKETKDFDALVKGLEMTSRQLDQILMAEGLQPMVTVGEPFNPELHQAIMQVESDEYGEGIVIEEVQKGYILKDKVLRPAMVKVSV